MGRGAERTWNTRAANDRDIILQTIGGTVPTAVRMEQVP